MLSVGKPMYRTIDEIYPRKIGITISNLYTIPQFQFPYLCNKENKLYKYEELNIYFYSYGNGIAQLLDPIKCTEHGKEIS